VSCRAAALSERGDQAIAAVLVSCESDPLLAIERRQQDTAIAHAGNPVVDATEAAWRIRSPVVTREAGWRLRPRMWRHVATTQTHPYKHFHRRLIREAS
jgi:hypothetical protein